jgi:allantoinase
METHVPRASATRGRRIEERLPAILSEGRRRGLGWERLASLLATNAAAAFRVERKGVIAPGAAADLVLWETGAPWTLTAGSLYERTDSAFAGIELDGHIRAVVRAGRVEWSRG